MLRVVLDGSPLRDGRRDAGIGRYVAELSRALAGRPGIDARLAVPPYPMPESWIRRYALAQPWIAGTALRRRAHLVHGMASDPILGWPLARQVVTLHDAAPWTTHAPPHGTPTWRYLEAQRRRIKRCGALIAVSDTAASEAESTLAVDSNRIHVVPEGVGAGFDATERPQDADLRRKTGAPDRYLLWVGSLLAHDPRKGLDELIDAVAAAGEEVPPLVLAGRAGEGSERVARRARDQDVAIVVIGYVDDETLAALYRGAELVVIPSHHEGFGLPLLEALASGAPVVASDGGNHRSLAGDAALLVPSGNTLALSSAIRAARTDPDLRARARIAGPKRAGAFTWKRAAELTEAVYRLVAPDSP